MRKHWFIQYLMIICTFIVALVMETLPWSKELQALRPAWLMLVLFYWILAIPNKMNIGWAWCIGIIWDLILGATLGIHALFFTVLSYFIAVYSTQLRNLSLLLQSILVIFTISIIQIGIYLIERTIYPIQFNFLVLVGAVFSGILWPWVFLLLRILRRKFYLR